MYGRLLREGETQMDRQKENMVEVVRVKMQR
jgi:hypothetical protein